MKLAKYLKWALLGISAILLVVFFIVPHDTASDKIVDVFLYWTYFLAAVAIVLVVGFLLIDISKSKKSLLTFLVLIVGAAALVAICYLLAPGGEVHTSVPYTPKVSKFTDTALFVTYALVLATFVVMIATAVKNAIKNR